jgi:hypothetical protein
MLIRIGGDGYRAGHEPDRAGEVKMSEPNPIEPLGTPDEAGPVSEPDPIHPLGTPDPDEPVPDLPGHGDS